MKLRLLYEGAVTGDKEPKKKVTKAYPEEKTGTKASWMTKGAEGIGYKPPDSDDYEGFILKP